MSDQLCLDFGLGPEPRRPKRPERVFACIDAGGRGPIVDSLGTRLMGEYGLQGSRVPANRLHISLSMYGDFKRVPSRIPFAVGRAALRVSAPAFEVMMDRVGTLAGGGSGRRATALLCSSTELTGLADALRLEATKLGLKATALKLPHMTLFYSSGAVPTHMIEPIRVPVRRFFLIHSELWLTRYNVLGCWRLGDGSATPCAAPLAFGRMAA
jgi:2'-5' RNA ligase